MYFWQLQKMVEILINSFKTGLKFRQFPDLVECRSKTVFEFSKCQSRISMATLLHFLSAIFNRKLLINPNVYTYQMAIHGDLSNKE